MSANKNRVPVDVDCFHDGVDFNGAICRSEFESLCQDSFEKVRQCLVRLKSRREDVHSVLVIGGSSRIPKFREIVGEVFEGARVRTGLLNADEAVARGAALHCAAVTRPHRVRPYRVTDLNALPVRVKYSGGKTSRVIPGKKTALECRPEGDTVALEYEDSFPGCQQRSLVAIYQLDLPPEAEGKIEMEFKLKKGRFELDSCTLDGREVTFDESRVGGLTQKQLSECRHEERRLMDQDRAEIRRQEVKNQLEEAVYTFKSVLSEEGSSKHRKVVDEASVFVQETQDLIDNNEGYPDWPVEKYQFLLCQVEEKSQACKQSLAEESMAEVTGDWMNRPRRSKTLDERNCRHPHHHTPFGGDIFGRRHNFQSQRRPSYQQPMFYDLFW